MRALVLSIVLLVGCQKPNEITNSTDIKTVPQEIANSTNFKTVPKEITNITDSEIVLESVINSIGMKLVLIPAGAFTMGATIEEVGWPHDATPHEVTISKPYYLGVYEVTQDEYEQVMGNNPSVFKGVTNPVEKVSWQHAVSFCKKLSDRLEEEESGRVYRLPTEAEWEYACRAGSKTAYSFGDTAESLG